MLTMVRQVKCQVPGCDAWWTALDGTVHEGAYCTDQECASVAERSEDLQNHFKMAHDHEKDLARVNAARLEAEAKKLVAETNKYRAETERQSQLPVDRAGPAPAVRERRAPLKCPTIEEACTESDWFFFLAEWRRYHVAVGLTEDDAGAIRHLWRVCSDALRQALHNDGAQSETVPDSLLKCIKSLAVKRRNNLVNIMQLQKMGQMRDEGVLAFLSHLNGQADLCDLNVECYCERSVGFKEKFKTLQLIRGLVDVEIQEKMFAAGAALPEVQELTLSQVVKMVEAAESAKSTRDIVSGSGGLNRLSDHQKSKHQKKIGKPAKERCLQEVRLLWSWPS